MKYIKLTYEVISTSLLILLILFLNIGTVTIIMNHINYLQFSKYLSYFGVALFILYLISKIIYKEKLKTKDVMILCLGILAYLSYIYAFNKDTALYGMVNRQEGLLSILTYYAIFLVATTIPSKNQKKIMNALLLTGIFQILIGTIQTLQITNILGYDRSTNWSTHFRFASGTFGNPNFYSTYILMCVVYTYGCLLKSSDKIKLIIHLLLTIIFTYGLIIGNTMSCILAFLAIATITLLRKVKKENISKIIITFFITTVAVTVVLFAIDNKCNNRISYTIKKDLNEVTEILKHGITDETGNYRIYVWKRTLSYFPKYIYTGIGIDNFGFINDGSYVCAGEGKNFQCFDKAHNEYLQILITEGIFALFIYLVLIIYTIYIVMKELKINKDSYKYMILLVFISYLIQACFNISVITVAPIYYMIIGFLHFKNYQQIEIINRPAENNNEI